MKTTYYTRREANKEYFKNIRRNERKQLFHYFKEELKVTIFLLELVLLAGLLLYTAIHEYTRGWM